MNYRKFGNTDLEVSEICFGPMRSVTKGDPVDDDKSKAGKQALERAIERGVNFIHSCGQYGTRWAIGAVLKDHPKRHDMRHIIKVATPNRPDEGRFDPARFTEIVEEALRDLHTDCIDVVQHLHRGEPNVDEVRIPQIPGVRGPLMETFSKLKDEGKVGYLATFPYGPDFAGEVLKTGDFDGMVAYYNPVEMEMAQYFPQMETKGEGFFCIRPFMGGLLTDPRVDRSRLPSDDRFQEASWDGPYERLKLLKEAFSDQVNSWTEFTIKFTLTHPIVASLIVGLNSVDQVDGVLDAADGNYLERSVFDRALEIFNQHGLVKDG